MFESLAIVCCWFEHKCNFKIAKNLFEVNQNLQLIYSTNHHAVDICVMKKSRGLVEDFLDSAIYIGESSCEVLKPSIGRITHTPMFY